MVFQIHMPNPWVNFEPLLVSLRRTKKPHPISENTSETRRAERDLINEMIWNNPDAFSCGLDVEYMIRMSRGRR